jgi:hypothetical protein
MRHAAARARAALAQPREGTILTVMSDVADQLVASCKDRAQDFRALLDEGLHAARRSLAETPQRLAALRHAGVVDAGALGFVHFLEGIRDHLFHETEEAAVTPDATSDAPRAPSFDEPLDFRYCTEAVLRGTALDYGRLLERLSSLGDSAVVAGGEAVLHAHVHTNVPALVLEAMADVGTLESQKVDDMWASLGEFAPTTERSGTAIVTDSVCDLPVEFVVARRIHVVPFRVAFGDDVYVDGVHLTPRAFAARLERTTALPTTSQPSPADFETLYRLLAQRYASIVSLHISAAVSGTTDSATRAARKISEATGVPIEVVDSRTASAGEACVVWAAARAADCDLDAAACSRVARVAANECALFVYVPSVRYFVLGGRLTALEGRIARWLRLLPVLTLREGRVVPAGKVFGRRRGVRSVLRRISNAARQATDPLFVISHSEAPELAAELERALRRRWPQARILVGHAGPALTSHSGPGGAVVATLDVAAVDRAIAQESQA